MDHQDEYYDNMITMLELIWGEGYMAPGGSGNVEKMLNPLGVAIIPPPIPWSYKLEWL